MGPRVDVTHSNTGLIRGKKKTLESDIEPKWISSHQAFFRERCTMTTNSRYVVGPRMCSMQIPERSAVGRYQAGWETMQTLYQHHKNFCPTRISLLVSAVARIKSISASFESKAMLTLLEL